MARSPSRRAHDQVLDAALKLFADRGIDATSMDAISEASGVSKATIYKHWPDKDALCLEVMARLMGSGEPWPEFDSGDLRSDLIAVLGYHPPAGSSELRACIMPHLMAYASRNPAVGDACRRMVFEPPRTAIKKLLDRHVARGALPPALDRDLAIALLLGPMMYSHLLRRLQGKNPENLVEVVVDAFLNGYVIKPDAAAERQVISRILARRQGSRRAANNPP